MYNKLNFIEDENIQKIGLYVKIEIILIGTLTFNLGFPLLYSSYLVKFNNYYHHF
jgi:hypothetical protein